MAKRKGYGQFCPVSKAAEVLAERWTPLVIRELLCGCRRFNEIRRGVPLMSPSLLSQRLKELERAHVIEKQPAASGRGWEYDLTEAGEELRPIIEALGTWGQRWVEDWGDWEEYDPGLLMWDVRRRVDASKFPEDRKCLVEFELIGAPSKSRLWWLVIEGGDVDLCQKHPGYDVDLSVRGHLKAMTEIWLGRVDLASATRAGQVKFEGSPELARSFEEWYLLSITAPAGRVAVAAAG
jgi:DNA-binding HxlR family transcriptional regulator